MNTLFFTSIECLYGSEHSVPFFFQNVKFVMESGLKVGFSSWYVRGNRLQNLFLSELQRGSPIDIWLHFERGGARERLQFHAVICHLVSSIYENSPVGGVFLSPQPPACPPPFPICRVSIISHGMSLTTPSHSNHAFLSRPRLTPKSVCHHSRKNR